MQIIIFLDDFSPRPYQAPDNASGIESSERLVLLSQSYRKSNHFHEGADPKLITNLI